MTTPDTEQRNDAVREAATLAVCRGIYGPDYDPFQHPEGYDFCEKIAASVLAAVRHRLASTPTEPAPSEDRLREAFQALERAAQRLPGVTMALSEQFDDLRAALSGSAETKESGE